MAPLIPTTCGEVFLESRDDILGGKPPSHLLPSKHPFRFLWQDTLSKLISNSAQSETMIDSYISIFVQDPNWKSSLSVVKIAEQRKEMTTLLRDHPPDIVVLDQPMDRDYGVHRDIRRPGMWSFICITEYWVQRWLRVVEFEPGERLALALETILRVTIAHGLGRWMTSLVSQSHSHFAMNVIFMHYRRWAPGPKTSSRLNNLDASMQKLGRKYLVNTSRLKQCVIHGMPKRGKQETLWKLRRWEVLWGST
jgi:hypothetical protein